MHHEGSELNFVHTLPLRFSAFASRWVTRHRLTPFPQPRTGRTSVDIMTDMDAILDEALDELDDESNESLGDEVSVPSPQTKLKAIGSKSSGDCVTVKIEGSAEIELNEESPAHTFQTVLRDFSEAAAIDNDVDEQIKIFVNQITIQKNASGIVPPSISTSKEGEVEKDLANLLEEMAKASLGEPSNGQTDDFLREMLGLQDEGGGDLNSDGVLDGMMEQLLSKDLMYEPMKQVTEKFPAWLETNKSLLSAKDYQK